VVTEVLRRVIVGKKPGVGGEQERQELKGGNCFDLKMGLAGRRGVDPSQHQFKKRK